MANIIKPKRSTVASKVPTTAQLASGEIAVNSTDQKIYTYDGTSILQIGAGKLSGLGDVVLTSLTSGQAITWNGTSWVNSTVSGGGGATGGGTNKVFYENELSITTSYTITTGKSAHSVGPITIASGAVVTIPSGSRWVIA